MRLIDKRSSLRQYFHKLRYFLRQYSQSRSQSLSWLRSLSLSLSLSLNVYAWDAVGHRLIAQIAYDQLSLKAKVKVNALTAVYFHSPYPETRFARAAVWPDKIKTRTAAYNQEHFVNLPIDQHIDRKKVLQGDNVVTAILQNEKILQDPNLSKQQRARALAFLVHFVGDITQPLHAACLVNAHFPKGDHGGNWYKIHSPIATNLHQLWDEGLGLFVSKGSRYAFHYWQLQILARQWMAEYPKRDFSDVLDNHSVIAWARESRRCAKQYAYTLPEYATPSPAYLAKGQVIVKQQIVLAGYRLADILNGIYSG